MKGFDLIFIPFWCGFWGAAGALAGVAAINHLSPHMAAAIAAIL